MVIFGKNRNFAFTAGAWAEIADLCPEHSIENLPAYMICDTMPETLKHTANIARILNKFGEDMAEFYGMPHNDPLPVRAFMRLELPEFTQLQETIRHTIAKDQKGEIEIVSDAKKNTAEEARP